MNLNIIRYQYLISFLHLKFIHIKHAHTSDTFYSITVSILVINICIYIYIYERFFSPTILIKQQGKYIKSKFHGRMGSGFSDMFIAFRLEYLKFNSIKLEYT